MRKPFRLTATIIILAIGFVIQVSLAGFLEWHGVALHFYPALFFFLLPVFPRKTALVIAAVCGVLYDGLWGVYPGVYFVSYIVAALVVGLLVRSMDEGRLPARFVTALTGLIIYTITVGVMIFWLKRSGIILNHLGWEAGTQAFLILFITLITSIYNRTRYKPVIYG